MFHPIPELGTYVHVDLHPIVPVAINGGCDNDQSVLGDKVADASLRVLVVGWERLEVELEGLRASSEQQKAAGVLEDRSCSCHGRCGMDGGQQQGIVLGAQVVMMESCLLLALIQTAPTKGKSVAFSLVSAGVPKISGQSYCRSLGFVSG